MVTRGKKKNMEKKKRVGKTSLLVSESVQKLYKTYSSNTKNLFHSKH